MGFRQARYPEPIIYMLGSPGRRGFIVPEPEKRVVEAVGGIGIPDEMLREEPPRWPELSEVEVARHFIRLTEMSYGVDNGPMPLGSCTMKYNPKFMLRVTGDERIRMLHPLQDEETVQGLLEILYELQRWLAEITGMDTCTLQPAAGAHGELTGVLTIRRYHELRGQLDRKKEIIVPDSAHGTNPASSAMAGFRVVEIPSDERGNMDIEALRSVVGEATAGLMLTNPNTLGLFEENILEIAEIVHGVDGLLYYDGANLNGLMGYARPGDMGFDIAHINIHKTFSSPHGGGGPGAGPVCVKNREVAEGVTLADLLPGPVIVRDGDTYRIRWPGKKAAGLLRQFLGNIGPLVWGYTYILMMGPQGLRLVAETAVLNTNYFAAKIRGVRGYSVPYGPGRWRKHEVVVSAEPMARDIGVTAEDVAKGLLDRGFYAPTIYFPLIVHEALMTEFTESETRENIDAYAEAMREIAETAYRDPEEPKRWPVNTSVGRIDHRYASHPRTMTPTWRVYRERNKA